MERGERLASALPPLPDIVPAAPVNPDEMCTYYEQRLADALVAVKNNQQQLEYWYRRRVDRNPCLPSLAKLAIKENHEDGTA